MVWVSICQRDVSSIDNKVELAWAVTEALDCSSYWEHKDPKHSCSDLDLTVQLA